MPDIMEQVLWVLGRLARDGKRNAQYYITHPIEAWEDLIAYAKENPWKFAFACLGVGLGIASIILPPIIGFGAAGPILGSIAAGWQSSIGSVVAGSAFAVIQSMAMTGAFTAIGGGLIVGGAAIPLLGGLFGSGNGGPGSSFDRLMYSSLDPERLRLLAAGPDALLRIPGMKPKPKWFLESKHSKVDVAESSKEGAKRRTLITNSKDTWDMVWGDLDAWRDGTIREHAFERFDVKILLLRPKRGRGEEDFHEVFTDHETDCHPECWCVGDPDDVNLV